MKERPILFSGEMVRAILDGRKTQTRRVAKQVPEWAPSVGVTMFTPEDGSVSARGYHPRFGPAESFLKNPFGKPGDRLWVRETFVSGFDTDGDGTLIGDEKVFYRATEPDLRWFDEEKDHDNPPWKPSIHMPRKWSRITLEITGVRVERLQDISNNDILDEGITAASHGRELGDGFPPSLRDQFKHLWESTGGDWDANPWVWVIEFRRISP